MRYVFIHGLGQKPSSWDKIVTLMRERVQAVCPDLSALMGDNEITYANLYRSFSDYCNGFAEPLNLCGLSLGCVLALNYGIDNPAKVQSLTLIAAQYQMPKMLLKIQNIIFKITPGSVFTKMGFQKKDFIALTNSMTDLNFSGKLKDISCPCLILCGEKDGANKKAAKGLAENVKGADFHFIKNAGHEANEDNPDKLAELLLSFIKDKAD